MKKQWIIACLIGIQGVNVQAQQPSKYPYQDTKLTAEQRADDLLQRLTLEEKVALMQNNSPAIPRLGIKPYDGGTKLFMALPAPDWLLSFHKP